MYQEVSSDELAHPRGKRLRVSSARVPSRPSSSRSRASGRKRSPSTANPRAHANDVDAWNRLGKALLELGRYREAREAYGKSLELDPVNPIAKRNLDRLSTDPGRRTAAPRRGVSPRSRRTCSSRRSARPASTSCRTHRAETLATLTAGDEVYLKPGEELIRSRTSSGDVLGAVEPKLALRLLRLIEGGNKYAAAVKSVDDSDVEADHQGDLPRPRADPPLLPGHGGEGVRPYIKESLLRLGR